MSATWATCCSHISQRWVTVFISFLVLLNAYSMRLCLSIAITEMVVPSNNTIEFVDDTCPEKINDTQFKNETTIRDELFEWSEYTQGIILSSFYWGYLFTNLPGGIITEKFGAKLTLGLGILSTAVLTLLIPASVAWGGSTALIYIRVLMGLGEGATYSAQSALLARWVPEEERSKAGALAYAGAPLGTIFGILVSGLILQYSKWPIVFYFFGTVGVVQFLLNTAFCYNDPSDNPYISEAELKYLKEKLKNTHKNLPPVPWRHILTSKPVWALTITCFGNAWGFLTVASDMPKYMSSVMKFSVENNGYLSSLPYLCMWLISCISSYFADLLIKNERMTCSQIRKVGSTIASIGPGIFLVAASYAGCDGFLVVIFFTIGMSLMGCAACSLFINVLDLAPNYAGIMMGMVNGIATTSGIVSPYIVGLLTPTQTLSEWRLVFWIVFMFFLASNMIFLIYGSGELQEWNDPAFLVNEKRKSEIKEGIQLLTIK